MIFLHGASSKGRKHEFCLLLCDRLVQAGLHVLSIDMRGFGDSENPLLIDSVDSWDSRGDVSEAVDFLIANANVDSGLICIVGHSAGVNQAIRSGIYDVRIKKIIAIGPSRRVAERILSAQSNERHYFLERYSRDRNLTELISREIIGKL